MSEKLIQELQYLLDNIKEQNNLKDRLDSLDIKLDLILSKIDKPTNYLDLFKGMGTIPNALSSSTTCTDGGKCVYVRNPYIVSNQSTPCFVCGRPEPILQSYNG